LTLVILAGFSFFAKTQDAACHKIVDDLFDIAWEYRNTDKTKGIDITAKALAKAGECDYKPGQGRCYNLLGIISRNQGAFGLATEYFEEALKIRQVLNDDEGMASVFNNMGTMYMDMGNFDEALQKLLSASTIYEKLDDKDGLASSFENVANLLDETRRYRDAIRYNLQSLEIYQEIGEPAMIAQCQFNISERYKNIGEFEAALGYGQAALKYYRDVKDWEGEALMLNLIGVIYQEMKEFALAEKSLEEGIDTWVNKGDSSPGLSDLYMNLAELRLEQNLPYDAFTLLQKARSLLKNVESYSYQEQLSHLLAKTFVRFGKTDSAYYYLNTAYEARDSIFSKASETERLKFHYEAERKDMIVTEKTLETERRTTQRNYLFFLFIAALIVTIIVVLYFFHRQKAAALIATQKEQIHQQEVEKMLKTQELKALHAMQQVQEAERNRIAKDLHDRLGSMLTTVKWGFEGFMRQQSSNISNPELLLKAQNLLDDAYEEVRQVAHNMVSGVLTKFGLIPALEELARTISESGNLKIEVLHFGLEGRLDSSLEIPIYRIVQELLGNALKYSKANKITIQINRIEQEIHLSVEDNGVGFDPETVTKGMGLKNIEARVQGLDGTMNIDSGKGGGTTTMISFPV
jgi:signal transduction histidine kinase